MPAPPNMQGGEGVIGQSFEAKLAPTGRVSELKGQLSQQLRGMFGGQDISQLFGSGLPGLGMLVLPTEPLQIGQQWTQETAVSLPLPGNVAGEAGPKADYKIQYTLKEIQQKGTHQVALIDSRMEIALPHTEVPMPAPPGGNPPAQGGTMSMDNFSQTVSGTHSFDVTDGAFRTSDHTTKLGMQMQMSNPGAPAGAAPGTMGLDGSFNMKVSAGPDVAKPAPAKAAPAKAAPAKAKPKPKGAH